MVDDSSSLICVGADVGLINARTGAKAAASSTATHRSGMASAVNDAIAASARLVASSAGKRTPAFGGNDDNLRARTTRPTPIAAVMSSSQRSSSLSCLVVRANFNSAARARVDSSRTTTGSSEAATTERRSGKANSARSALAATARSSHSATRSFGSSCSAIWMRPAAGISSLPSALSRAFCSCTAWRTAGIPPCKARSATGRCASGRSASTADR